MKSDSIHIHVHETLPIPKPFKWESFIRDIIQLKNINSGHFEFNFISDQTIHEINKKHLNHDYPTDIITFNLGTPDAIIADIYISVETAAENAIEFKHPIIEELKLLIIHGILHLLNYSDYTDEESKTMCLEQDRILKLIQTNDY
jgi:probable rRNA maturation factor